MISTRSDNNMLKLMSIADVYGLQQLISQPTRITPTSSTLINLIYTNCADPNEITKYLGPEGAFRLGCLGKCHFEKLKRLKDRCLLLFVRARSVHVRHSLNAPALELTLTRLPSTRLK